MNAQDAVALAIENAFPREVVKLPLFGADNIATPHYGLCFEDANCREDWIRTTCKQAYVPHTRQDVIDICTAAVSGFELTADDVKVDAHFVQGLGHAVAVTPTVKYRRSIFGGDTVFPTVIVRAYYGNAFRATVGLRRDVCDNMMLIKNVAESNIWLAHSSNFREHFDQTVDQFRGLIAKSDNIVEAMQALHEVRVKGSEITETLYPEQQGVSKRTQQVRDARISRIVARMVTERWQLDEQPAQPFNETDWSLWEIVNGVQGYAQHDKKRVGKKDFASRAFTALNDSEVQAAYDWAFEVAGLAA